MLLIFTRLQKTFRVRISPQLLVTGGLSGNVVGSFGYGHGLRDVNVSGLPCNLVDVEVLSLPDDTQEMVLTFQDQLQNIWDGEGTYPPYNCWFSIQYVTPPNLLPPH